MHHPREGTVMLLNNSHFELDIDIIIVFVSNMLVERIVLILLPESLQVLPSSLITSSGCLSDVEGQTTPSLVTYKRLLIKDDAIREGSRIIQWSIEGFL